MFRSFLLHRYRKCVCVCDSCLSKRCHLMPFVYCVHEIALKWLSSFFVVVVVVGINDQIVLNNMLNYDVFAQMNGLKYVLYALNHFSINFFVSVKLPTWSLYLFFCLVMIKKNAHQRTHTHTFTKYLNDKFPLNHSSYIITNYSSQRCNKER